MYMRVADTMCFVRMYPDLDIQSAEISEALDNSDEEHKEKSMDFSKDLQSAKSRDMILEAVGDQDEDTDVKMDSIYLTMEEWVTIEPVFSSVINPLINIEAEGCRLRQQMMYDGIDEAKNDDQIAR